MSFGVQRWDACGGVEGSSIQIVPHHPPHHTICKLNPYVRWSTIFQSNASQPIQFNLNWTRIGKNCQSITNTGEMTRIGISPNLCQFWANPGKIYQCDDINRQFPANQTQRNLTAHRQVWASNLWHEPSCNWSLTDPEKFIANPENFNANPGQSSANITPIDHNF